jgi:hypothetical protein
MGEDRRVSAPRVLLLRLIEELLRFGERRRQLLNQDVTQLAALDKPVTLQEPGKVALQMIYPEKSQAWYEFLRLEWARKANEAPRYYEEMARAPETVPAASPLEPDDATRLPDILAEFLGGAADPKVARLRLVRAPFSALFAPLRILPKDAGITEEAQELTMENINQIVRATSGRTIVQLDARSTEAIRNPLARKQFGQPISHHPGVPVFVVTEAGPGLLLTKPDQMSFLTMEEMPKPLLDIVLGAKGKPVVKGRPEAVPVVPRAPVLAEQEVPPAQEEEVEDKGTAAVAAAPQEEEEKEKSAEVEPAVAAPGAQAPVEEEEKEKSAEAAAAAVPPPPALESLVKPKTLGEKRAALAAERAAKEANLEAELEPPTAAPVPTATKKGVAEALRAAAEKRKQLATAAAARTAQLREAEGKSAESTDSLSTP